MLGKNIKYYRLENNFTQDELAKIMNVSKNTISTWERDKQMPDRKNIEGLYNTFGITEYELFCHLDANDSISKAIDRLHRLPEASQHRVMAFISEEWSRVNP